jgi:hypothetical protein
MQRGDCRMVHTRTFYYARYLMLHVHNYTKWTTGYTVMLCCLMKCLIHIYWELYVRTMCTSCNPLNMHQWSYWDLNLLTCIYVFQICSNVYMSFTSDQMCTCVLNPLTCIFLNLNPLKYMSPLACTISTVGTSPV